MTNGRRGLITCHRTGRAHVFSDRPRDARDHSCPRGIPRLASNPSPGGLQSGAVRRLRARIGNKEGQGRGVEAGARATEGRGPLPRGQGRDGGCRGRAHRVEGERREGQHAPVGSHRGLEAGVDQRERDPVPAGEVPGRRRASANHPGVPAHRRRRRDPAQRGGILQRQRVRGGQRHRGDGRDEGGFPVHRGEAQPRGAGGGVPASPAFRPGMVRQRVRGRGTAGGEG